MLNLDIHQKTDVIFLSDAVVSHRMCLSSVRLSLHCVLVCLLTEKTPWSNMKPFLREDEEEEE